MAQLLGCSTAWSKTQYAYVHQRVVPPWVTATSMVAQCVANLIMVHGHRFLPRQQGHQLFSSITTAVVCTDIAVSTELTACAWVNFFLCLTYGKEQVYWLQQATKTREVLLLHIYSQLRRLLLDPSRCRLLHVQWCTYAALAMWRPSLRKNFLR